MTLERVAQLSDDPVVTLPPKPETNAAMPPKLHHSVGHDPRLGEKSLTIEDFAMDKRSVYQQRRATTGLGAVSYTVARGPTLRQ